MSVHEKFLEYIKNLDVEAVKDKNVENTKVPYYIYDYISKGIKNEKLDKVLKYSYLEKEQSGNLESFKTIHVLGSHYLITQGLDNIEEFFDVKLRVFFFMEFTLKHFLKIIVYHIKDDNISKTILKRVIQYLSSDEYMNIYSVKNGIDETKKAKEFFKQFDINTFIIQTKKEIMELES